MQNYKILGPNESGKGILIEMDAGYISPTETRNLKMLQENKNFLKDVFNFYLPKLSLSNRIINGLLDIANLFSYHIKQLAQPSPSASIIWSCQLRD